MSRLLDRVNSYLAEKGMVGRAHICAATGKSDRTVTRWLENGRFPTRHDAYTTAVAIGCDKEEAHTLARECFPEAKTA